MRFKKITAAFLAVLLCICTIPLNTLAEGKEFETAHQAVANMRAGIHIANSLNAADFSCDWYSGDGINPGWEGFRYNTKNPEDYETAWGNPPTSKEYIAAIKNAGFNSVRLSVTFGNHADKDGNIHKEWLDRVQDVSDMILAEDMYCIISFGADDAWISPTKENYTKNYKRFSNIWKNIALRFKDYGEKLMLEGFNESYIDGTDENGNYIQYFGWQPKGYDCLEWHNKYMKLFIDAVRKTGGNNKWRNLVIPTYGASIGTEPNGDGADTPEVFDEFRLPKDKYKDHFIIDTYHSANS